MIIALFPTSRFAESFAIANKIREFLEERNVTVVTEDTLTDKIKAKPLSKLGEKSVDIIISMGGDGTILRLYNKYIHLDAPILGINLGNLGFMADIQLHNIFPALEEILAGSYKVDKRLMIKGTLNDQTFHAVNDIVFHRSANQSLIEISIHVNGLYMNTYVADGIIIATPNGSTAYSLSAGGPIVTPTLNAFVITPICAHTISNRPFVIAAENELEIKYLSKYNPIEVRADGLDHVMMQTDETFKISKSDHTFKLTNLVQSDYYTTVRSKLGWSGSSLNHKA